MILSIFPRTLTPKNCKLWQQVKFMTKHCMFGYKFYPNPESLTPSWIMWMAFLHIHYEWIKLLWKVLTTLKKSAGHYFSLNWIGFQTLLGTFDHLKYQSFRNLNTFLAAKLLKTKKRTALYNALNMIIYMVNYSKKCWAFSFFNSFATQ